VDAAVGDLNQSIVGRDRPYHARGIPFERNLFRNRAVSSDAYIAEGREARILGGMHFRTSLEEGARQGVRVGNWVLDHYLLPVD
jgi:hypothetical protein